MVNIGQVGHMLTGDPITDLATCCFAYYLPHSFPVIKGAYKFSLIFINTNQIKSKRINPPLVFSYFAKL